MCESIKAETDDACELTIRCSVARMELSKLVAAFFLRFHAEIDSSMTEESMELFDQFSGSPVGGRLLLRITESQ